MGGKRGVPEKSRWASSRRDVDVGRVSGNILRMRNDPKHCGSFGSVITRTKIALPYATQHTGELHLDVPVAFNSEGGQVLGFLSGAELVIADGARRDLVGRNRVPRQHVVGCVTRSVSRCALVFSEKFNLTLRGSGRTGGADAEQVRAAAVARREDTHEVGTLM